MIPTAGSLFSGIGGLDLAASFAGFDIRFHVEIDDFCRKVLTKHARQYWPNAQQYADVKQVGRYNLESVDVLFGGFPCQDVSVAGERAGLAADTRTGLWFEFARVIGELQPRVVILENVPGLRSLGGVQVVADLTRLGYDAIWFPVRASDAGAPHKRERWFCVAYAATGSNTGRQQSGGNHQWSHDTRRERLRIEPASSSKTSLADPAGANGEWVSAHASNRCFAYEVGADPLRSPVADSPNPRLPVRGRPRKHTGAAQARARLVAQSERCGIVADSQRAQWRQDNPRRHRTGAGKVSLPQRQKGAGRLEQCRAPLALSSGARMERRSQSRSAGGIRPKRKQHTIRPVGREVRPVESGICRNFDGISTRIYGVINATASQARTDQALQKLRETASPQAVQRVIGRIHKFSSPPVLRRRMFGGGTPQGRANTGSASQTIKTTEGRQVRAMRHDKRTQYASPRPESGEQRDFQFDDLMCLMSHKMALGEWEDYRTRTVNLHSLWLATREIVVGDVPETLPALQEIWQSLPDEKKSWVALRSYQGVGLGQWLWPAPPGHEQYDYEPPRVATGIPQRTARLKALGNAVVPQVAYPIFLAVRAWLESVALEEVA